MSNTGKTGNSMSNIHVSNRTLKIFNLLSQKPSSDNVSVVLEKPETPNNINNLNEEGPFCRNYEVSEEGILKPLSPSNDNKDFTPENSWGFNEENYVESSLAFSNNSPEVRSDPLLISHINNDNNNGTDSDVESHQRNEINDSGSTYNPNTSRSSDGDLSGGEETVLSNPVTLKNIQRVKRRLACQYDESLGHDKKDINENVKKRTRKVIAAPETWKKNISKTLRAKGEEYTSRSGKQVAKRVLGNSCNCKLKCGNKLSEESRRAIFKKFWQSNVGWEQRKQFVSDCIKVKEVARRRPRNGKDEGRRKLTYEYVLQDFNRQEVRICKKMFLSTLSIKEKFVRNTLKGRTMQNGVAIATPDKRKNHVSYNQISKLAVQYVRDHIERFPPVESHYRRATTTKKYLDPNLSITEMYKLYKEDCLEKHVPEQEIVKESYYRFIFNTQFNLSFKIPSTDTCDDCDYYKRLALDCNDDEKKNQIEIERAEHHQEAELRYELKAADKIRSRSENSKERVCTMDLQKCLPTPCLSNGKAFYLLKLWTLNLTICDVSVKKTHCMIWNESIAGRGSNEIASCLLKYIETLPPHVEELTIWSDNCSGQNRNINLIFMYMWVLRKYPTLKVINHKYLLKGHTHMEVDVAHSIIEKRKKSLNTMQVSTTHDWVQLIKMSSKKTPFEVYEMNLEDFKNFASLGDNRNSPFLNRKKNAESEVMKLSNAVHLQLTAENLGELRYKTNFKEDFKVISLLRRTRRKESNNFPQEVPIMTHVLRPIPKKKYDHLMTLLQWVPDSCKDFFKNLPFTNSPSEEDD